MRLKNWLMVAVLTAMSMPSFGALTVSDITARQRYPWNGLVDIAFTVSGSLESGEANEVFTIAAKRSSGGAAIPISALAKADGANVVEAVASGADGWTMTLTGSGTGRLIWNTASDVTGSKISAVISINSAEPDDAGGVLWEGGPYWAACNLGANKPEESGLYFWWGDTTGHRPLGTTFEFDFLGWEGVENPAIGTYCKSFAELQSAGWVTSEGVLAPGHDAAHVKWGGNWRMPTRQELRDLCDKCDWTRATLNGVNGYVVRGRGTYASSSIFLPCAGGGWGTSFGGAGSSGLYWSSYTDSDQGWYRSFALTFTFESSWHDTPHMDRYRGFSVRPVQGSAK